MRGLQAFRSVLIGGASMAVLTGPATAKIFDIPRGDLEAALNAYTTQAGIQLIFSDDAVRGHRSNGAKGQYSEMAALTQLLKGTGFTAQMMQAQMIGIVPEVAKPKPEELRVAQTRRAPSAPLAPAQAGVETVVVTAQKKSENIQNVPIAVTALSQQQLTERQIAGGPDLLRDVPNMNFGKTNFSGYSIELRGIGTQAISVTTDPAVAVAFNGTPFIRNHFFEQEFYDLSDVEVLRGPQGTLYGRNATAGVVNLKSAEPTDQFEAMGSVDFGNFSNRRLEGMINIPIVGDKLDLRMAGEWTMRDGYTQDTTLNASVDGRDLWSGRLTLGFKPTSDFRTDLVWEHFSEDDNRLRSSKQLCQTAVPPAEVDGIPVVNPVSVTAYDPTHYLDQGCTPTSLYAPSAFQVPDGATLAYYEPLCPLIVPLLGCDLPSFNPYLSTTQSTNLRNIEVAFPPKYRAKNDTLELNANWSVSPALTFTSQTGYNSDFLFSNEDYNRFNTTPGAFVYTAPGSDTYGSPNGNGSLIPDPLAGINGIPASSGIFCDPQIGCSDKLVAEDLSTEHAWQFSQEFRLASSFDGPLNFSFGGNYLHYETVENYYVFINTLTLYETTPSRAGSQAWLPGVSDNHQCLPQGFAYVNSFAPHDPLNDQCGYIDPNPIGSLNNQGHNYFLSQNPYTLNSYALFGELYYTITPELKAILGARWTEDQKHFIDIPSELLEPGYGYPVIGVVNQKWDAPTGRAVLNWTPKLDFTDQTLVYASYAHGYKAGGATPPGAALLNFGTQSGDISFPVHPLTFKPEFIDAFELGTKNTLLDDSLTLNGDLFYYAYRNYQISEIVDRTAINNNYDASVYGAEAEANWEPLPGLKFGFAGGYENATANAHDTAIDLMDRTAGVPGWTVIKPFPTQASNCVLPSYVVGALIQAFATPPSALGQVLGFACGRAYNDHVDPVTGLPYQQNPTQVASTEVIPPGYPGFDPFAGTPGDPYAGQNTGNLCISQCNTNSPVYKTFDFGPVPNNGAGFDKRLGGNHLPNSPDFTASFTAEYTIPVSQDWVATLHGDFYWQSDSWARIINDNPYDKLRGYTNVNLSIILNSANGWQVMGYVKNIFDTTAITGDFLNSDDSALTTNVFLTDPRLFGVRITKHLDDGDGLWGSNYSGADLVTNLFSDADNGKPPLWIEIGGNFDQFPDQHARLAPQFLSLLPANYGSPFAAQRAPLSGLDWQSSVAYTPQDSDWDFVAAVRYGRAPRVARIHNQTEVYTQSPVDQHDSMQPRFADTHATDSESHLMLDFMVGKKVGLGMLGLDGTSVLNGGLRYAAFGSRSTASINAVPDSEWHDTGPKYRYHSYSASFEAKRSFHGIGPAIDWSASTPLFGNNQDGVFAVDWGANGSVLFGRKRASGSHKTAGSYYCKADRFGSASACPATPVPPNYQRTRSFSRSRTVTVPNIGAFAGVSWKYQNAKISFGYRADEFFGAMDGGIDTYKSENRGFFGPYANISIGLGG